ncbi:MAG: phosphoribosylamine--glycine ligase [Chloroflexi bacterium]|nr:phosphoribosylamine--glycine ligase [Chloroflexota bacterium]
MTAAAPHRILLVGGGGREHALTWRLAAEPGVEALLVLPGSDGIATVPGTTRVAGNPLDPEAVLAAARAAAADLVVVGPEAPLAAGVADRLVAAGIPVFGPVAAAARIETSKAFCHEIAEAAGVRMARAAAFSSLEPALGYAREVAAAGDGAVIKADGLAAGKGVTVCDDAAVAEAALRELFASLRPAGAPLGGGGDAPVVVVEERLRGPEASLIALADGTHALALPPARDHKRIGDADTGPNTGGMGAYSPVPDLPDELAAQLVATIHRPVLAELARRGIPFRGALYAGLMLTADGPVLLEFNARFGDPETQAILPRLATPLGPLLLGAAEGRLADAAAAAGIPGALVPAQPGASVAVVLAAAGYPGTPRRGDAIHGLAAAAQQGALVFHAGTARTVGGGWTTDGGRVLAVVGRGRDLPAARAVAEGAADAVRWQGVQRRHDIALVVPPAGGTGHGGRP